LALILALALGVLATACGGGDQAAAASESPKTLKIGALVSLTGFASAAESLLWQGHQLFQDWVNQNGGLDVGGHKYLVDFVVADCESTAEGALAAASKLVSEDHVSFVVGPVIPFLITASGTVTEPAQVLRVALYGGHTPDEYGPNTPYTFIANDCTTDFTTPDLQYMKENFPEVKKVGVLSPDDGAPQIFEPMFVQKALTEGLVMLPFVLWPLEAVTETDFAPYVAKALAMQPDALMLINGYPAHMGVMLKVARESGFTGPIFGCHEDPYEIARVAGSKASDNFYVHNIQMDSPEMTDMIKEILALAQEKFGKQSPTYIWAFNADYCLMQAIEAARSVDPTIVKESWENLTSINTVYGPGKMGGLETYGIEHNVTYASPFVSLRQGKVVWVGWRPFVLP
jgi:branched-chain amino acid transport system substrate-binding protein